MMALEAAPLPSPIARLPVMVVVPDIVLDRFILPSATVAVPLYVLDLEPVKLRVPGPILVKPPVPPIGALIVAWSVPTLGFVTPIVLAPLSVRTKLPASVYPVLRKYRLSAETAPLTAIVPPPNLTNSAMEPLVQEKLQMPLQPSGRQVGPPSQLPLPACRSGTVGFASQVNAAAGRVGTASAAATPTHQMSRTRFIAPQPKSLILHYRWSQSLGEYKPRAQRNQQTDFSHLG